MALLKCEQCGFDQKLPDKYVDRKVRCPQCEAAVTVQADAEDLNLDDVIPDAPAQSPQRAPSELIPEHDLGAPPPDMQRPRLIEGGLAGNLVGGLGSGLLTALFSVAVASLVFSKGPMADKFPTALSMALVSAAILSLVSALRSRVAFAATGPESMGALALFLLMGHIQAQMGGMAQEAMFPTMLAAVVVCALFTGVGLLATGLAGSSDFIRYIPIQAVGGVLAGVGWLILYQAFELSLGQSVCLKDVISQFYAGELCLRWAPAMGLGLVLFVVVRWVRNSYAILLTLALAAGAAYGFLHWQGISLDAARTQGWLFDISKQMPHWEIANDPTVLTTIAWGVLLDSSGYIFALAGLVIASVMIRVTEMEVVIGRPIDLDAEFRVLGLGNILSALAGGMPGTMSLDRSLANRGAGARGILSGLLAAVVCAVAFAYYDVAMDYMPTFLPAGMLATLGLLLLWRWLVETRARLSHKGDYSLLLLIFLLTATLGLLKGMAIGAALAMLVTAVRYGSVSVVKLAMSGANFRSNVDRAPAQIEVLKTKGDQIYLLTLQGFIFLGTTNRLLDLIASRARDTEKEPLRFVIMDFTFINGLDSSVAISFIKLKQMAAAQGFTLVFTNVPFELEDQLARSGCVLSDQENGSITVTTMDYALEWAEDHILDDADELHQERKSLSQLLEPVFPDPRYIPVLMKVLKRVEVPEGKPVFRQGDPSDSLYFIERGMVDVELALEGGKRLRLKKMGPGTVFGEMGLYTASPRTASIIAAEDCVLYRLSTKVMKLLQAKRPELASAIHRFVVSLLAGRVASANATIRDILR